MARVDLNCDLGEGAGRDAELMPLLTSASIACGAHAGDAATMRATIELALRHGVAVGAHPGYADREHFGRRELDLPPGDVAQLVVGQVIEFQKAAQAAGATMHHVKLHGALYNQASRDRALAEAVVEALAAAVPHPRLYVLSGSVLERVARARPGCAVAGEVFADRTYRADGALTPRSEPGALIEDEEAAVAQVLRMVRDGRVRARDGADVPIAADTVCLHGDGARAVEFARRLRGELTAAGVELRSCGS